MNVLLIGGASGVGKSRVSYPLAVRQGVPLLEVDDIVEALLAMTTPDQQPVLHYWRTHPQAGELPVERIVEMQIAFAATLAPALAAVIDNHVETGTPVVIEGDYLLPALARRPGVRAVFLHEPDVVQLAHNYQAREPEAGAQTKRAEVSAAYSHWLAKAAESTDTAVVASRPWETAVDRVCAALDLS